MPQMSYTPKSTNDKSNLTDGWHPAYLLAITDEPTPPTWTMFPKSPRMYRWCFAIWERPEHLTALEEPERQTAPSSQAFSPKRGQNAASKAYLWTKEFLGREIQPGEAVDLDPLLPLPCRVKVARNGEYANIVDLERWPDGPVLDPQSPLLPLLRDTLDREATGEPKAVTAPAPSRPAFMGSPVTASPPGMTGYSPQPPATGTPPARPRW